MTWEKNLNEGLPRSAWPVGLSGGGGSVDCLNECERTL